MFLALLGCVYQYETRKEDHVDEPRPEKPVLVVSYIGREGETDLSGRDHHRLQCVAMLYLIRPNGE